jgi:AcrR family transcriptional regulator
MTRGAGSPTRRYESSLRRAQAEATERRIIAATVDLVVERGWASTTMTAIAGRAGVSPALLYKRYGSKVALARRAYDVALVGDQADVSLAGRADVAAISIEPDPARKVERYVGMARGVTDRVGPFWNRLVAGARAGDTDLAELVDRLEAQRAAGVGAFVARLGEAGALPEGLGEATAADIVWVLVSPAVFASLNGRGWSNEDVERWLSGVVPAALGHARDLGGGTGDLGRHGGGRRRSLSPSAPPGSGSPSPPAGRRRRGPRSR